MRFVQPFVLSALSLAATNAAAQTTPAPAPKPAPAAPAATPTPAALADKVPASPLPAQDDPNNLWLLDLSDGGRVTIWLRPDKAPTMVNRVKTLTRQHYYDGLDFFRVVDGFMAQGGDSKNNGTGGSPLPDLPAEFNDLPHTRGAVAAARTESNLNSANSQFYIVFQPVLKIDRKYTIFGRVISGMQYVDAIERGEPPRNPTRIVHAYIAADGPPPYQPGPATTAANPGLGDPVSLTGAKPTPAPTATSTARKRR